MKQYAMLLLAFVALAAGQLLTNGIGSLPTCADSCAVLTAAQSACGTSWSCFCKNVWSASGEDIATVCNTACTNPADQANVATWYSANCGDDNGASEHPATTTTSSPTSTASSSSSSNSDSSDSSNGGGGCGGSWWHCHYQWVVAVIVVAIVLIILGFGARWWKKRHDRKRDQNRAAFNSGITAHSTDEKAAGAAPFEAGSNGSESSARTREAFMPYGYGYTRSESRNDEPVITRGGTPFEEMEKGEAPYPSVPESSMRNKMKRVMVRERSIR